jgi:hypothetical protein
MRDISKADFTIDSKYSNGKPSPTQYVTKDGLQFMSNGYVVLKNFIPKDVIQMVKSTWTRWENSHQINTSIPKHVEYDTGSNSPRDTHNTSESPLDNAPWATALQDWATPKLEEVLGIDLVRTYAYSRKYHRNGYMKVHSDRPACEISFTAPMDFKTDFGKPWNIWVDGRVNALNDDQLREQYSTEGMTESGLGLRHEDVVWKNTQGLSINKRKQIKGLVPISLEVGDVMVYQGPNVFHWRDRLVGDYSYHIFCHWVNENGKVYQMAPQVKYDGRDSFYEDYSRQSEDRKIYVSKLEVQPEFAHIPNDYPISFPNTTLKSKCNPPHDTHAEVKEIDNIQQK